MDIHTHEQEGDAIDEQVMPDVVALNVSQSLLNDNESLQSINDTQKQKHDDGIVGNHTHGYDSLNNTLLEPQRLKKRPHVNLFKVHLEDDKGNIYILSRPKNLANLNQVLIHN